MTNASDNDVLRAAIATELARAGVRRTDAEIAQILKEKIAFERDMDRQRPRLNPLAGTQDFFDRLRTFGEAG
jgi:hypothetical protein